MLLSEAYRLFKANPTNIMWSTIAKCGDGSLAVALWDDQLELNSASRTLVHESRVAEWGGTPDTAGDREWFRFLPDALAGGTPIRLIVAIRDKKKSGKAKDFNPRPDLVGRVTMWDQDHLRIEFSKSVDSSTV